MQPTHGIFPEFTHESLDEKSAAPDEEEDAEGDWRVVVPGKCAAPEPLSLKELVGPPEEPDPAGDDRLRLVEDSRLSENDFEDVNLIMD